MDVGKTLNNVAPGECLENQQPASLKKTLLDSGLIDTLEETFANSKIGDLNLQGSQLKHNLQNRTMQTPFQSIETAAVDIIPTENLQFKKDIETSVLSTKTIVTESPETAQPVLAKAIKQLNVKYNVQGGDALMNQLMKDCPEELAQTLSFSVANDDQAKALLSKELPGSTTALLLSKSTPEDYQEVIATALKNGFETLEQPQKLIFAREMGKALVQAAVHEGPQTLLNIVEKSQSKTLFFSIIANLSDKDIAVLKVNSQATNKLVDIFQKSFDQMIKSNLTGEQLKAAVNFIKINPKAISSAQLVAIIYNVVKSPDINSPIKQTALGDLIAALVTNLNPKDPDSVKILKSLVDNFSKTFDNISKTFADIKTSRTFVEIDNHLENREIRHSNNRLAGQIVGTIAAGIGKAVQTLGTEHKTSDDFRTMLLLATAHENAAVAAAGTSKPSEAAAASAMSQVLPLFHEALIKTDEVSRNTFCAWKAEIKHDWLQNHARYGWDQAEAYVAIKVLDNVWEANALAKC